MMKSFSGSFINEICISLDITAVIPEWLAVCVPNMCTFSKPLNDPPPSYDDNTGTVKCHIAATFG